MLNQFLKYVDEIRGESPAKFKELLAKGLLCALGVFYLIGVVLQQIDTVFKLDRQFTWNPAVCLGYSLFSGEGWGIFLLLCGGAALLSALLVPKRAVINPAAETDDKGVVRKQHGTYGSARKVGEQEADEYYEIGKAGDVSGMIFGQFDHHGKRVCAMKAGPTDNQNVYVVGSPGTGKSFALIRSAILQCVKKGESFAVVDPKGELIRDLFKTVKEYGYASKIYNLVEPEYSDSWDCLGECFDDYGDLDSTRSDEFVSIVIANTEGDEQSKGDPFYVNGETNLLSMYVNYVLQQYIEYVINEYKSIITKIISCVPEIEFYGMPKIKSVFGNWRYARNMYGARSKMWQRRLSSEDIVLTMDLINGCISAEDVINPVTRPKAKEKLKSFFDGKKEGDFHPDVLRIFMEEMFCHDERWIMDKKNMEAWCSSGIKETHRCDLRAVLYELLCFIGKSDAEAKEAIETIEKGRSTPLCTISEVYYLIITKSAKDIDMMFSSVDPSSPAGIAYHTFRQATETTQMSWKQGLSTRLSIFKDRKIRRITGNKDIELSRMGEEPTAIWVKISDKNKAYSVLTSLFFSFLISDNSDAFDHAADQGKRLPIKIFMDEAANVGVIKALPIAIASIRGRKMSCVIVVQKMTHLDKLYGESDAETIQACCDYIVFLGSNDRNSAQFMETRAGIETIQVASEREAYKKFMPDNAIKNYMVNIAEGKRNVYNMDEIWTLEPRTLLLAKRGAYVLKLNSFGWDLHPLSNGGALPQMRTIEYSTSRDKYPYFDYCLDSFYCRQPHIINIRRASHMELPHVELDAEVDSFCRSMREQEQGFSEQEKPLKEAEQKAGERRGTPEADFREPSAEGSKARQRRQFGGKLG